MTKEISKEFAESLRFICNCDCYKYRVMICENSPCLAIVTLENPLFVFTRFLEACDYGRHQGFDEKALLDEAKQIWDTCEATCIKDRSKECRNAEGKRTIFVQGEYAIISKQYSLPTIQ